MDSAQFSMTKTGSGYLGMPEEGRGEDFGPALSTRPTSPDFWLLSYNSLPPQILRPSDIPAVFKVENILKCSLDSITTPSAKIQILGSKVCMRWTFVNKLLTSPINVLPYYIKSTFLPII